ncbi:D-alanyl-D-alanine carboxypeptidase/D-alanyl-D-alanine-endopeptidase [uncultured Sulfitobacter sp.]|uniref:D-alanyl-D-alanine carboxypeptidase/D-alanyl-D-alanine endopeptidase n=1 Tax=uncultured Sulfitobacter sp. TaxID=191468 RepID=UPI00263579FE|nr:D-alanyl-D-alanine carboxypeptidase/D-alanyl-D-alanine-endopeptidase [uncultured Sulfitobacter sp.]
MGRGMSRRGFLRSGAALMACAPTAAYASPPDTSLRPVLRADDLFKRAIPDAEAIIRGEKLTGRVAFAVADAASGDWLECAHEHAGTPPASVTKAVTALYALDTLGAEHRFETRVCALGGLVDGVVQGDLVLIGGGDPTLDTDGLAGMAAALKEAGVREVKGGFKIYEAALPVTVEIDPDQPDHVGYNPAVSALALNYNRVHFEWKRGSNGYGVTMDARTAKYRPAVAMAAIQVKDRSVPVYTYENQGGKDRWTVARGALGKGGARWLPVRKPGLYAGDVFATLARSHGIRLKQPELIDSLPKGGDVLVRWESGPLRGILRDMLKYSTNLTAEMVGLAASTRRAGPLAGLRASAAEMNVWAAETLGMARPALVDHSGLGDDSRLTALDMAKALLKVQEGPLRPILKPFRLRDKEGRPMTDGAITVDAKTGTLNFVSSLAGYITAPTGQVMAFAIFAADGDARAKVRPEDRERPPGARTWNRRAKRVQQGLIERWAALYGSEQTTQL